MADAAADYQFTRLWGYGRQQDDFATLGGSLLPDSVANFGQRLDDLATFRGTFGFAIDRTFICASIGGRYWRMQADKAQAAFPLSPLSPIKFETDRNGGFVQVSYKLDDLGLGEAGAPPS